MFSLSTKATQLHCVFMHNICKRKQHLLYERLNLHYLLIYPRFRSFLDALLLTSETVFYRNIMGQSLNRSNPIHQSTGEGRGKELFIIVPCCWNSVWKRRQLRREETTVPMWTCYLFVNNSKVGDCGQETHTVGLRKAGDAATHPPLASK